MNMNNGYVSLLVLLDHKCRIWYRRSRDPNTNTANRVWPWRRSSFVVRFVCNSSITANSGWWHDVWCLWSVFWSFSRALSWPSTVFDLCQQDIWCYYSFKIWFIITSYCQPNLEKFCDMWKMTSIVQQKCQIIELLTEKTWGRGWIALVVTAKQRNISLVSRGKSRPFIG